MRKLLGTLVLGLAAMSMTSCAAGPHQLKRTVDDYDQKMYVDNPLLNGVCWVIPAFPLAYFVAGIGDFFVTDAYSFWFKDVWDGKGTAYDHLKVEPTDGSMGYLFGEGNGWLKTK